MIKQSKLRDKTSKQCIPPVFIEASSKGLSSLIEPPGVDQPASPPSDSRSIEPPGLQMSSDMPVCEGVDLHIQEVYDVKFDDMLNLIRQ